MQAMEKNKTNSRRLIKYALLGVLLILVAFRSVYFRKLDEVKVEAQAKEFDPKAYAENFWNEKLIPNLDQAIDLGELYSLLQNDPKSAFEAHSHALGIGNIRFFLVQGNAVVEEIREDELLIKLEAQEPFQARLATEFIFGNAVRDASGLISINEFKNTMDFNHVSEEINRKIREEVVPSFKSNLVSGDSFSFYGAIELNQEHLNLEILEIIPIQVTKQGTPSGSDSSQ